MKKSLVIIAMLLVACTPTTETDTNVSAPAQEEAPAKPAPEPAPRNDLGDYSSVVDYTYEALDTSEAIVVIFETMGNVTDSVMSGEISFEDGAMLAREAATTLRSHRTFYENREPPTQFRDTNRHIIDALRTQENGMEQFARCMETLDMSYCDNAIRLLEEAITITDRVGPSLPDPNDL